MDQQKQRAPGLTSRKKLPLPNRRASRARGAARLPSLAWGAVSGGSR
jgi:hypothetical protein